MQPELYRQMRDIEDRHWWFRGRRRIVSEMLVGLDLPAGAQLLDLGCGTGGNLGMLSGFGTVTGVEMDAVAAGLARERGEGGVLEGYLPDHLPAGLGRYDCITMTDVLEHIGPDAESLRVVNGLLNPGGRLLLTVPAFPFLWGPHDTAHHHQRRYRAGPLRELLQGAGFRVLKLSYYNTWLFPPAAAVRLLRRLLPAAEQGGSMELALPPAPLNALLEALFASERHLLKRLRLPFGISLLAVCHKA
jgi:SAM-dependent methyltransferase